ncbi:Acetyltransferase (GNAT) family protein [Lachnospiraceae bacterium NLAE-zl-G231]|nr:Acetyltransferase (GNAT) family protein [Lachnospiraceae bacterium NLAE-zl-G231]
MVSYDEYLKNPCGSLSLPYWKSQTLSLPANMRIVHDSNFFPELLNEYTDERYFRLYHNLKDVENTCPEAIELITASQNETDNIVSIINNSYYDIHVDSAQMESYMQTPVYCKELWLLAVEKRTGKYIGSGIADYDPEIKELILEWIQVLPPYRGKGIGQALVNELLLRMKNTAGFATVSGKVDNPTNPEALYRRCGFTGDDIWHILQRQ